MSRSLIAALAATFVLAATPSLAQERILAVLGGASQGATDGGAVGEIDPTTGAFTALDIPVVGDGITGLAVDSTGRLFASTSGGGPGSSNALLIELDPDTGALIQTIGNIAEVTGAPAQVHDLTFQPGTDVLYASAISNGASFNQNDILTLDLTNAVATLVGTPNYGTDDGLAALAFDSAGTLWAHEANGDEYWTLDPTDGSVLTTSTNLPGVGALALGARPDGQLYLAECCNVTLGNDIFLLDPNTGTATLVGPAGADRRVHDIVVLPDPQIPVVEVPTVGGWGMALLIALIGLAGTAFVLRRRPSSTRV